MLRYFVHRKAPREIEQAIKRLGVACSGAMAMIIRADQSDATRKNEGDLPKMPWLCYESTSPIPILCGSSTEQRARGALA